MELMTKQYYPRDVFFNNGLVNLYMFCKEKKFDFHIELVENYLEIVENDELYSEIFVSFIKDYKIIRPTDNPRLYFDESTKDFRFESKYTIEGASSGNDIKNSYITKTPEDLGIDKDILQDKYLNFCLRQNLLPELKNPDKKSKIKPIELIKKELKIINKKLTDSDKKEIISYLFDNKNFLNVPDGDNIVTIYSEDSELIKNAMVRYFVKDNPMKVDSKIHQFETKIKTLFDMLKAQPNYHRINKWEALIYWFGGRIERYFIRSQEKKGKEYINYILLPNSSNLKSLYLLKKDLKIPNESITYKTQKGKLVDTYSNIDFYNRLSKDEIKKQRFYESKSIEELELKFMMFLFSNIYHIEKEYGDLKDDELALLFDEDTFDYSKMLFDAVQNISFVTYSYDKNFKYSLNEYTKAYQLMMFFLDLKEKELFGYLGELIYQVSISKKRKLIEQKEAYNQNIIKLSDAILNFKSIVKILYDVSYDILQTDEENKKSGLYKRLGYSLYDFLNLYSQTIKKGEDMSIHDESKKLGQQIGDFVAKTKDKDLLFKIRNIKNFKQMVAFLKDVEFAFLREHSEDKKENDYLDTKKVLELLTTQSENWDLIKDYMAIYAIEQFKYKTYKKQKGDK